VFEHTLCITLSCRIVRSKTDSDSTGICRHCHIIIITISLTSFRECCSHYRFQPIDFCLLQLREIASIHLQILLMDTRRQYGSWSAAGHSHMSIMWQDPICAETLNGDHVWWVRSQPGCQIVGSVTTVWLITEADDLSSLHCAVMSTGVMSDHTGHQYHHHHMRDITYNCCNTAVNVFDVNINVHHAQINCQP